MENSEPEAKSQNIGDTDIQYLKYSGEGPTAIMLHATGFSPWLWHPISKELSKYCQVIAPYFCDHREIDPEQGGFNWGLLAEDLCRLCETLRIDAPLVVGHSMGATVATLANSLYKDIARKMILIEPIFLPQELYNIQLSVEQHPLASKSIKRRNYWKNRSSALRDLQSKPFFQSWDNEILEIYLKYGIMEAEAGGLQLTCSPHREASLFMGGMQYDPWPLLSKISCPVLLLEGELSENRSYIDVKTAAQTFPNGIYQLVHGAGHLIPMEKPLETLEIIKTFFGVET
jgi:pimeloyl-ACP methyl ester carboxylesterase